MNSSLILSITTFVYALAAFLYVFSWVFKKNAFARIAFWVTVLGIVGNSAGIIVRWIESYSLGIGHAPFSSRYESLIFFSWVIAVVFIAADRKYKLPIVGTFTLPLAFLVLAYASLPSKITNISSQIQPLVPALQSNWLIAHVITCFIAYAAFAIAFGVSIMYLMKQGGGIRKEKGWISLMPDTDGLDDLSYQLVMFGFLFLTVGIITGAVWANSAWGRYWGWDIKETWSLITWLIYAALLHARNMRGWRGKRIAYLSIIGFAAVLTTYLGLELLSKLFDIGGLHVYGSF
jgi:cytochrome c-type biogenesis protein CcsB